MLLQQLTKSCKASTRTLKPALWAAHMYSTQRLSTGITLPMHMLSCR